MARAGPTVTEAIVRVALDGASGKLAAHQDTIYHGRFSNLSVTSDGTQLTVDDGSFDNTVVAGGLQELLRGVIPPGPPLVQASSPVFGQVSPDGERLLITRRVPNADGTEERRFTVRAFTGGAETPLSVTGRPLGVFWADSVNAVVTLSVGDGIRYSLIDVRNATVLRSLDLDAAGATAITPLANGWAWINWARDRIIVEQGGSGTRSRRRAGSADSSTSTSVSTTNACFMSAGARRRMIRCAWTWCPSRVARQCRGSVASPSRAARSGCTTGRWCSSPGRDRNQSRYSRRRRLIRCSDWGPSRTAPRR